MGKKNKNAPHCTAVGLRSAYPERCENSTAWDNEGKQLNVSGIVFLQIVHVLDVYIVVCMHAEKHYLIFAL